MIGRTPTKVSDIATPDLVSETLEAGERIHTSFIGSAEGAACEDLATYLESIHEVALASGTTEVVIDLRAVEFMSASCLRSMLAWLDHLKRSPRYTARLLADAKKPWQRRTIQSLAAVAGDRVRID
jgi:hypothetical protein